MVKIVLELESCKKCPYHYSSPFPASDSWERPEYYWCTNPDVKEEHKADAEDEERRKLIKEDRKLKKLSYVAGYVEWSDDISIPYWCPIKLKE